MLKRIFVLILCILFILQLGMAIFAHPQILSVSYDECTMEELIDGDNEI